jgi:hypothetical protein
LTPSKQLLVVSQEIRRPRRIGGNGVVTGDCYVFATAAGTITAACSNPDTSYSPFLLVLSQEIRRPRPIRGNGVVTGDCYVFATAAGTITVAHSNPDTSYSPFLLVSCEKTSSRKLSNG